MRFAILLSMLDNQHLVQGNRCLSPYRDRLGGHQCFWKAVSGLLPFSTLFILSTSWLFTKHPGGNIVFTSMPASAAVSDILQQGIKMIQIRIFWQEKATNCNKQPFGIHWAMFDQIMIFAQSNILKSTTHLIQFWVAFLFSLQTCSYT